MSNQANIASWITAIVLPLSLVPPAHGQTQAPTMNNRIGDITNNQGIITQGQTGNNTIINPINRDANGVYQGNTKVGSAPPPVVDEPTGIATFQAVTFTSYPDPSRPLEYGNLLLSAVIAPRPRPNTFVGSLTIMIAGFKAKVIGKR